MLTDSVYLFNVIVRFSSTAVCRLTIDLTAVQEAYNKMDIDGIGWIRALKNIADGFTKISFNKLFDKLMEDGILA